MDSAGALLLHQDSSRAWAIGRLLARRRCLVTASRDETDALRLLGQRSFRLLIVEASPEAPFGLSLLRWARRHAPSTVRVVLSAGRSWAWGRLLGDDGRVELDLGQDATLLLEIAEYGSASDDDGARPAAGTNLVEVLVHAVASPIGGEVVVRHEGEVGRVFAVGGRVAWCVAPRQGFLLDDLAAHGIPRRTLRHLLEQCRLEKTNFAETLIGKELIGRDPMRAILGRRIRRCLKILFGWRDAQSLFLPSRQRFNSDLTFTLDELLSLSGAPRPSRALVARAEQRPELVPSA